MVAVTSEKVMARFLSESELETRIGIAIGEAAQLIDAAREERGCEESQEQIVLAQACGLSLTLASTDAPNQAELEDRVTSRLACLWEDVQRLLALQQQ